MNLFSSAADEKREKLDKAIDRIRDRYGSSAVRRASLVQTDEPARKGHKNGMIM